MSEKTYNADVSEVMDRILDLMVIRTDRNDYGPWIVILGNKPASLLLKPYYRSKLCAKGLIADKGENTLRAKILDTVGIDAIATSKHVRPNVIRLVTVREYDKDNQKESVGT